MSTTFSTIDEYIALFDKAQQVLLNDLRLLIQQTAPDATETINYKMPTFRLNGNLIHFALFKNHLGIYPGPEAILHFESELGPFKTSKGAIQLPLDRPLPTALLERIVRFNRLRLKDKLAPDWKKYDAQWDAAKELLLQLLEGLPLVKTFKWGGDVYTYAGRNVLSFAGFKEHFALWFYNGVFLTDKGKFLVAASEGKTKALRQWRFKSLEAMQPELIKSYIQEAIQVEIEGLKLSPEKPSAPVPTGMLKAEMENIPELSAAFLRLSPGKQREYIAYIAEAKQEKTKRSRLDKIIPLILQGKSLHDKYMK